MPAPERLLYVKPVLGNTYAAVAASTAMSSWQQPADRTSGASAPTTLEPPLLAGYQEQSQNTSADEPFPEDAEHQLAWREAAKFVSRYDGPGNAGVSDGRPGAMTLSHTGGSVSGTLPGDDDPFYFIDNHAFTWMPTVSFRSPSDGLWQPDWRPSWAPGAIGYEVEQYELDDGTWAAIAQPLSASIQGTLVDVTVGGAFTGPVTTLAINDRVGPAVIEPDGDVALTGPPPNFNRDNALAGDIKAEAAAGINTADPVDFALAVDDFGAVPSRSGLLAIWLSTTVPLGNGLTGIPDSWPNTGPIHIRRNASGLLVTYTIRPPRIRWIFPSDPYRRTYPRDDALAGGATRTWPPARSVQSSNRTYGGYL